MYMFFKSINTCICCSVLVVTYIYKKQRMYMLFNTRCNINMFFKKINKCTCHLIYFDEQCFFRQVGSQGHYMADEAMKVGYIPSESRRLQASLPKNHVQAQFGINLRLTTLNFYENREKSSGVCQSVRVCVNH